MREKNKKVCVVCGREFFAPPSSGSVCCGPVCSKTHRRELAGREIARASIQKAKTIGMQDPRLQRGEQHINAKKRVIKSPDGETYHCHNLLHWCREHEDILPGTARQAWDGLSKIKYSMQGKRRHPCYTWRGWTLIDWGD